jgi:DNA (cytosine-5)-methyltransferase 1
MLKEERMMRRPVLLDLYCKAGGAGMGYYRAGYKVIGVDHEPQPRYPFQFFQRDALQFVEELCSECADFERDACGLHALFETSEGEHGHAFAAAADYFDAIHASPPCQPFSITRKLHSNKHPDLISATRTCLMRTKLPYIIENVIGAPLLNPVKLCGVSFGLKVFRHRIFESNAPLLAPPHQKHDGSTGSHRGYSSQRSGKNGFICVAGHNFERKAGADAMGIDWMASRAELSQAIPPAYTEFIGRQLIATSRP